MLRSTNLRKPCKIHLKSTFSKLFRYKAVFTIMVFLGLSLWQPKFVNNIYAREVYKYLRLRLSATR